MIIAPTATAQVHNAIAPNVARWPNQQMNMKTENRVTLTQLADHLEQGKCIHTRFDFAAWNSGMFAYNSEIPNCKTNGCAIGEMPFLDKRWTFSDSGNINIDEVLVDDYMIAEYFEISVSEALHLFLPTRQQPNSFGGKLLRFEATKAEVIHNIREFVRITGKN